MALFFAGLVLERWEGHWAVSAGAVGLAAFFAWSVTFGRLYTGMVRSSHDTATADDKHTLTNLCSRSTR